MRKYQNANAPDLIARKAKHFQFNSKFWVNLNANEDESDEFPFVV